MKITVTSDWDWERMPLRYDPSRGYLLCQNCWDGNHFNPRYKDKNGTSHPATPLCLGGGCHCGCRPELKAPRKPKFTHEGQTEIPMTDAISLGPHPGKVIHRDK
jgi:hypothetical protein